MNKYYKLFAIFAVVFLFNCEQDDSTTLSNYAGFEQGPLSIIVEKDLTATKEIKVSTSEATGSDRTFTVLVNEEASSLATDYTVPATVTIPANSNIGTLSVSITDDDSLEYAVQTLVLEFQDEVGLDFGSELVLNVTQLCPETLVKLELTFDDYAEEASWEIYDLSGTPAVIYSGGQGGAYDDYDGSTIDLFFCLSPGNYGVVVYDAYGDGGTDFVLSTGDTTIAEGSVPDTVISSTFIIE